MAAFQIETGSVTSRDFSAGGFMGKFKTWIVKTYGNGGPQWYITYDNSGAATNPFIVVSNQSSPSWDSGAKFVKLTMLSASETIQVDYYLWWNTSTQTGFGNWHRGNLTTQTASFVYDFRGGPEFMMVTSRIGSSIYWSYLDEWAPITNMCESTAIFGHLTSRAFKETGDTNNQISGYQSITGYTANLDGSGNLYFSVIYSAGSVLVNIYKDSARTQLIGHTANGSATGSRAITADNSSGLGGSINVDAIGSSSNTGISCRFLRLDLQSGEGANFTPGNPYYIFDESEGVQRVGYFTVASVVGDQIILNSITASDFASTSTIGPYLHPFIAYSSNYPTGGAWLSLPYMSDPSNVFMARGFNTSDPSGGFAWVSTGGVTQMAPDDNVPGRYAVMRPLIYENAQNNSTANLSRAYGRPKNIYMSSTTGLAIFQDGRLINGNQYLYFFTSAGNAMLVRNYSTLS